MAKFVLKDAVITVNGVDLSDHATSVTMDLSTDEVEVTGFSSGAGREFLPGLKSETITVNFLQDFAAAEVDATLWPLYNAGSTFTVTVKPTSAATSATNPQYSATCALFTYSPIAGDVGSRSETSVTFRVASGVVTRATS
jgi:hypothetical protein